MSGTSCNNASMKMTRCVLLLSIAAFCGSSFAEANPARPDLPPVTPAFCAKTICFLALGPYATQRFFSLSDVSREGGAVKFQDGTSVSFGAVTTQSACNEFSTKWARQGELVSVTYLCLPSDDQRNTLVAVKIRSYMAPMVGRFEGESDICVWKFSTNKVAGDNKQFLPISHETCVGDRMGYALPTRTDHETK